MNCSKLLPNNQASQIKILASQTTPFAPNSLFNREIKNRQSSFQIGSDISGISMGKSDGLFSNVNTEVNPLELFKKLGGGVARSHFEEIANPVWITKDMLSGGEEGISDEQDQNENYSEEIRKALLYIPNIITKLKLYVAGVNP